MSANNSNDRRDEMVYEDMYVRENIVVVDDMDDAGRLRAILVANQLQTGVDIGKINMVYRFVDVDEAKLLAEQRRRILLLPGHKLSVVAGFLLPRGAFKRYVEPVIADMQEEYIEALAARREWHAWWIGIRGRLLIIPGWLYALVAGKLATLLRRGQ